MTADLSAAWKAAKTVALSETHWAARSAKMWASPPAANSASWKSGATTVGCLVAARAVLSAVWTERTLVVLSAEMWGVRSAENSVAHWDTQLAGLSADCLGTQRAAKKDDNLADRLVVPKGGLKADSWVEWTV